MRDGIFNGARERIVGEIELQEDLGGSEVESCWPKACMMSSGDGDRMIYIVLSVCLHAGSECGEKTKETEGWCVL